MIFAAVVDRRVSHEFGAALQRGVEDAKIECACKFFAEVNKKFEGQVKYDAADSYSKLMELVVG